MIVKAGFDDKPLHIRISKGSGNRRAEVWVEQEGLKDLAEKEYQRFETLAYATLEELLDLQDELKEVIRELTS